VQLDTGEIREKAGKRRRYAIYEERQLIVHDINLALGRLRQQTGHALTPGLKVRAAGELVNLVLECLKIRGLLFEHGICRTEGREMGMQNAGTVAASLLHHFAQSLEFLFDFTRLTGNRMKEEA
jgi:hypothetical protein